MCELEDGLIREKIRKEKRKIVMIIVRDNISQLFCLIFNFHKPCP